MQGSGEMAPWDVLDEARDGWLGMEKGASERKRRGKTKGSKVRGSGQPRDRPSQESRRARVMTSPRAGADERGFRR